MNNYEKLVTALRTEGKNIAEELKLKSDVAEGQKGILVDDRSKTSDARTFSWEEVLQYGEFKESLGEIKGGTWVLQRIATAITSAKNP